MSTSVLVAGGTGLVGRHLVELLAGSEEFDVVKVLVRKDKNFEMEGVEIVEIDYDRLEDHDEVLKAEVVFCCLGTTIGKAGSKQAFRKVDYEYPFQLAKICLKNGSRQFNLITSGGASSSSRFFYNRVKGDVEAAISGLGYHNLNIYRPSLLLGSRKEKRKGELLGAGLLKMLDPVLRGSFSKFRAIEAELVAKGMMQQSKKNIAGVRIVESHEIRALGESYKMT